MAIPASGPISMSMFNTELGRAYNQPNSALAGGINPDIGSLIWLANVSGSLNMTAPHNMSEWYSYATASIQTITWNFYLTNVGSFDITINGTVGVSVSATDGGTLNAPYGAFVEVNCDSSSPSTGNLALAEIEVDTILQDSDTGTPSPAHANYSFYVSGDHTINGYASETAP